MKIHQLLKHFLLPHAGNEYTPHILRKISVLAITGIGGFLFLLSASNTYVLHKTDQGALVVASVLVDLTNKDRETNNELALVRNKTLDQAAYLKAQDMVKEGYFAHNSPKGLTPWYWFDKAGYTFVYAGENLAINFSESDAVETAWLNSPLHRANILNGRFTEIGLATIDGEYNGKQTTFVVQMFGTPAFASVDTNIEKTAPKPVVKNSTGPSVEGESIENKKTLVAVENTPDFVAVQNTQFDTTKNAPKSSAVAIPQYSTWYERFMFNESHYISILYKILITIVALSLLLMFTIEIKRHHIKHIVYGCVVLCLLAFLYGVHSSLYVYQFIF